MVTKPILQIVQEGDLESLKSGQLAEDSLINARDDSGATALHHAARKGDVDMLQFLTRTCHMTACKRSVVGATPAHDATVAGQLASLRWLLQNTDCDVRDKDYFGNTVAHLAARYGHRDVIRWLVTHDVLLLMEPNDIGALPLHFAVMKGSLDIVKFLVEQDPRASNVTMTTGATPAYLACQEGHLEMLSYLFAEGTATLRNHCKDGMSCVHAAALSGNVDILAWLVCKQGQDVNAQDFDGATSLHYAVTRGHYDTVKWLLEQGAVQKEDHTGSLPLHDAVLSGNIRVLNLLLKNGGDPLHLDHQGATPADLARKIGHMECVRTIEHYQDCGPASSFNVQVSSLVGKFSAQNSISPTSEKKGDIPGTIEPPVTPTPPPAPPPPPPPVAIVSGTSPAWPKVQVPAPPPLPAAGGMKPSKAQNRVSTEKKTTTVNINHKENERSLKHRNSMQFDLLAELKASNGRAALRKPKKETEQTNGNVDENDGKDPQLKLRCTNGKHISKPVQGPVQLREEFSPKKFLDKVPLKDTSGGDLPPWKRQIIAKQMAEKAQKEADELKKKEEEEARYRDLPPWKQAILKKKEAQAREDEEKRRKEMPPLRDGEPDEKEFTMVPWQAELRTKRLSQQIMEQQFGSQ